MDRWHNDYPSQERAKCTELAIYNRWIYLLWDYGKLDGARLHIKTFQLGERVTARRLEEKIRIKLFLRSWLVLSDRHVNG